MSPPRMFRYVPKIKHTGIIINPYHTSNPPLVDTTRGGGINRVGTPEFAAGGEHFGILDFKMYLEMLVFSCKNPKLGL